MIDNQKNQPAGHSQNKTEQQNQNPQQKTNNPTPKSNDLDEEEEESTDAPKEYPGQEHQHDYKTPTGSPDTNEVNQNRDGERDQSPNRGSTAGSIQNDNSESI
jgi:hypothetical protein